MTEGPKHDVFISFARGDRVEEHYVRAIVGLLRGYGLDVCHDETHIDGQGTPEFMEQAVASARRVVPHLTKEWSSAFKGTRGCGHEGVQFEREEMKKRERKEGTWSWVTPVTIGPRDPENVPPALAGLVSRAMPSDAKDLLADLDRANADNASATLEALFALARTEVWDGQDDRARRISADIGRFMATCGSAFQRPTEAPAPHVHRLCAWAQSLAAATRHDPGRLLLATEAILDAFADARISPGEFGTWAELHFSDRDLDSRRRPWVLRLALATKGGGLHVSGGTWIRSERPLRSVAVDFPAADLAKKWEELQPPAAADRDLAVLSLDVPHDHSGRPDRLEDATATSLRSLWGAVTYWPTIEGRAFAAHPCPGRGPCRLRPTTRRAPDERLQVVEITTLSKLVPQHHGHVLTIGADDPDLFAGQWRDASGYARTRDAFLRLYAWVTAGHDALLVWTDKDYELLEPWEP